MHPSLKLRKRRALRLEPHVDVGVVRHEGQRIGLRPGSLARRERLGDGEVAGKIPRAVAIVLQGESRLRVVSAQRIRGERSRRATPVRRLGSVAGCVRAARQRRGNIACICVPIRRGMDRFDRWT